MEIVFFCRDFSVPSVVLLEMSIADAQYKYSSRRILHVLHYLNLYHAIKTVNVHMNVSLRRVRVTIFSMEKQLLIACP